MELKKVTFDIEECVKHHRRIMAKKHKAVRTLELKRNEIDHEILETEKAFNNAGDEMIKDYCQDHGLSFKGIKEIINPSR